MWLWEKKMPKFFADNVSDNEIILNGEDAQHISRSLRMSIGENLTVVCASSEYECEISAITSTEVYCKIKSSSPLTTEPSVRLTLFQAVPKSDKLEFIVQKAVELGAVEVVPVLTQFCVSRPDKKGFDKKKQRLQKIALNAAMQAGRGIVPAVGDIINFDECINRMKEFDSALFFYEKAEHRLDPKLFENAGNIAVLIGSEGGFSPKEAEKCRENGLAVCSLGKRILRCETAGLCAMSIIMNLTGNI